MPPLTVSTIAVGAGPALVGPGDVEGDVGGERRLAHARAAGEDDEVGRLQAAHVAVEVAEAGRDAGQRPVALIGPGGHVDGDLQRVGEALEAAVVAAASRRSGRGAARPPRSARAGSNSTGAS